MRKHYKNAKTLATIILIVATIIGINISNKIIATTVNLLIVNDTISFYNNTYIKTDEATESIKEYFKEREELYENEDNIISGFASQNPLVKELILAVVFVFYFVVIYMWTGIIRYRWYILEKRDRERRRRERKARLQQKYRNN